MTRSLTSEPDIEDIPILYVTYLEQTYNRVNRRPIMLKKRFVGILNDVGSLTGKAKGLFLQLSYKGK